MQRRDGWVGALALAGVIAAVSPGAARAKETPQSDPEVQKRALVIAMEGVLYEKALGDELLVEYETHGVPTDVEISLRRKRKRLGRPLRVRVEAGNAKVRQYGWAARASSQGGQKALRELGLAGFRALFSHLDLDGDFRLDFVLNTETRQGEAPFAMTLYPSTRGLGHHPHVRPLELDIHGDGSTQLVPGIVLRVKRPVTPIGI